MNHNSKTTLQFNKSAHNKLSNQYENLHPEIFNEVEQERLESILRTAMSHITNRSKPLLALDYGCGSGNLTRHLLKLGFTVTAADLSEQFLEQIQKKFSDQSVTTLLVNGTDLSGIKDNSLHLAGCYSVLHHVPDYLKLVEEMVRVTRPGGIIYIDHEACEANWNPSPKLAEYIRLTAKPPRRSLRRYLRIEAYLTRIRRLFHSRYNPEGDIHVFADDHIEWTKIEEVLRRKHCEIILKEDYLNYSSHCPLEQFHEFQKVCVSDRVVIARKSA